MLTCAPSPLSRRIRTIPATKPPSRPSLPRSARSAFASRSWSMSRETVRPGAPRRGKSRRPSGWSLARRSPPGPAEGPVLVCGQSGPSPLRSGGVGQRGRPVGPARRPVSLELVEEALDLLALLLFALAGVLPGVLVDVLSDAVANQLTQPQRREGQAGAAK